eukprot:CAMPEP_0118877932 /NCGR_PEP_ID=MMETSP1163-20130328/18047_1 /TAXON_ID=124430 /ORGANISM="Phaeomonas parva, Strain CCMP2877" /LENGTH=79 /DNA_ID=CAMNT_0006813705 /DNA_START=1 /DNA_END=241 /DNA_ORIENTATION=-
MAFAGAITPDEATYPDDPLHLAPMYYRLNTIAVIMVLLVTMVALVVSRAPAVSSEGNQLLATSSLLAAASVMLPTEPYD